MDKIATLALRNFPKSLTPPFFAPHYSHLVNSAVRLGLKKHGYGIMKNKSPMKTRHYSQKAIIATLPGVLPVRVRKKRLILTLFISCHYPNKPKNNGKAARVFGIKTNQ